MTTVAHLSPPEGSAPRDRKAATRVRTPRRQRVYTRRQKWIITIVNLALFFVIWQLIAVYTSVPTLFLPSVTEVVSEIGRMQSEGILWGNLGISAGIYLIGLAISMVIAIPLGLLIGGLRTLDKIASPYVWAIYTTPRLILMPLILLWVGINDTARVVIIVLSAVPATLVVVMDGVKTVDNSLLRAARSFGAGKPRLFRSVVLPSCVPYIATGVRMGVSRGLIGLFIGELFTGTNGIGYIIVLASKTFNSSRTFAMLLMFVAFCVLMVSLSQLLERRVSAWRPARA